MYYLWHISICKLGPNCNRISKFELIIDNDKSLSYQMKMKEKGKCEDEQNQKNLTPKQKI